MPGRRETGLSTSPVNAAERQDLLYSFRAEFAIADAGANFHLRPDCRDCADDFSALVHGDAVAAT